MTEVLLTHVVPVGTDEVGTCGHLLPNVKARVVDTDTGEDLKAYEDGEIWVKTPSVSRGGNFKPKRILSVRYLSDLPQPSLPWNDTTQTLW